MSASCSEGVDCGFPFQHDQVALLSGYYHLTQPSQYLSSQGKWTSEVSAQDSQNVFKDLGGELQRFLLPSLESQEGSLPL